MKLCPIPRTPETPHIFETVVGMLLNFSHNLKELSPITVSVCTNGFTQIRLAQGKSLKAFRSHLHEHLKINVKRPLILENAKGEAFAVQVESGDLLSLQNAIKQGLLPHASGLIPERA